MEPDASGHPELLPQLRLDELLAELQGRLQAVLATRDRMRGLLEAVVAVSSGLDLESTLRRIVQTAVRLVDATYGALGVIGNDGQLAEFIPVGLSEQEIGLIDHWPVGRGLLGLLAKEPQPLRLASIAEHAESSGFPAGHPAMRSFLGVPVRVRDEVFGNLYLTNKRDGGEFTEDDEMVLLALGAAAGVAVENARLYQAARRSQRWMQASAEVTTALLSGAEPGEVLARITSQARDLSDADIAVLALPDEEGQRLTVTHADGDGAQAVRGLVLPMGQSISGQVLATGDPVTSADFAGDEHAATAMRAAMSHVGPAVIFPLGAPGSRRGVLTIGRRHGRTHFPQAEAAFAAAFAAQAGVALELAASRAEAERLSVYQDRDRIARDLHDLVIQRLYATGMSLQGTMPMITRPEVADRVSRAVDDMDETIKEIRGAIFALQARDAADIPSDPRAGIVRLVEEMTAMLGFAPSLRLGAGLRTLNSEELTEQALAVLREALSNMARHAGASRADVTVDVSQDRILSVTVTDNGTGIPPGGRRSGLGNLADRAAELGGELRLSQAEPAAPRPGTRLEWRVPVAALGLDLSCRGAAGQPGRVGRRLGAAFHAELGEQHRYVVLDGLLRQEQPFPDLPVGQALADQLQDAAFPRREPGQRVGLAPVAAQPGHDLASRTRVQRRLARGDRPHRADQVGAPDLLEHESRRPRHDGVEQGIVVAEGGQHQARHRGHPRADLPAHRDAVAVRQPHVKHGHVRPQRRDAGQRGGRRARLADHRDVRLRLKQVTHAPADNLMVIEQEHGDLLRGRAACTVRLACHRDHPQHRVRLRNPDTERSRCPTPSVGRSPRTATDLSPDLSRAARRRQLLSRPFSTS